MSKWKLNKALFCILVLQNLPSTLGLSPPTWKWVECLDSGSKNSHDLKIYQQKQNFSRGMLFYMSLIKGSFLLTIYFTNKEKLIIVLSALQRWCYHLQHESHSTIYCLCWTGRNFELFYLHVACVKNMIKWSPPIKFLFISTGFSLFFWVIGFWMFRIGLMSKGQCMPPYESRELLRELS